MPAPVVPVTVKAATVTNVRPDTLNPLVPPCTVTAAPGIAPLLLSITEPPIWPLSPWAWVRPGVPTAKASVRKARTPLKRCTFPPPGDHLSLFTN